MRKTMQKPTELTAISEVFRAFCIGMDTPRSLKASMLISAGDFEGLARMKIHPSEYTSADEFACDYAVVSFLKKNADLPKVVDTREAAITAFARSEALCRQTNELVEAWQSGDVQFSPDVSNVLHIATRKIARLLSSSFDLSKGPYSWGPGATLDLKRSKAYPDSKVVDLPFTVTGSAWKHAAELINADLHWKAAIIAANHDYTGTIFKVVPGGRYDTVPKTVLTDRSIIVEPRLNTILQKRAGSELRHLLKRVGVDLNDQSSNQLLAEVAYFRSLATLDLEMASDSIARKLVEILLPEHWFSTLDDLRSKWVQTDKGSVRLEKFSSMGNGFTFELESLIFWAFSSACNEVVGYQTLGVYGDDIIVRKEVAPLLTEVLRVFGFTLNKEKSFVSGNFFESCGKHYFKGIDVTPLYQKSIPADGAQAARMGNRLLRFAARLGLNTTFDKRVYGAWATWRRRWGDPTGADLGPYIGEGNGYWEAPASYYNRNHTRRRIGVEYHVACYSDRVPVIPACPEAMYALWLMQNHDRRPPVYYVNGERPSQALNRLRNLPRAEVSITRNNGRIKISNASVDSDCLPSRIKYPCKRQHRWVQEHPLSTILTW